MTNKVLINRMVTFDFKSPPISTSTCLERTQLWTFLKCIKQLQYFSTLAYNLIKS
jgi:hypothetical protein